MTTRELVWSQIRKLIHVLGDGTTFQATGEDGLPAVVPEDERWLMNSMRITNTSNAARELYVWAVPMDQTFDPVTPAHDWLVYYGELAAKETTFIESSGGAMVAEAWGPGTVVWIGGDANLSVTMHGWRVKT